MHIVITGASAGIGAAIARAFGDASNKLTLVARRRPLLEELSGEIAAECHLVTADLSVPDKATEWVAEAEAKHGPVDVLINNAGIQIIGHTKDADVEAGEKLLRLNVHTPLRLTRHVLPAMVSRGNGTIVDISSMAAIAPTPGMFYYNASKGALAAASEALRGELKGTGVHVVTVYPGIIAETDLGKKGLAAYQSTRLERMQPRGSTRVLANMIVNAVASKKSRIIYPRFNALARTFPGLTRWLLDNFSPPLAT